jgi:hypothetical protein
VAVERSITSQTSSFAGLGHETIVVIIPSNRLATLVLGVEDSILRGVAGEAIPVFIAGHAVIFAVGAGGPSLALL